MNKTTHIYFADKNGNFIFSSTIENAAMSPAILWNYLTKKYYGTPLVDIINDGILMDVFNLLGHKHMPPDEAILLSSTHPGTVMKRSDAEKYFAAIMSLKERALIAEFPSIANAILSGLHKGAIYVAWEYNQDIFNFWDNPIENKINIFDKSGVKELITLAKI